MTKKKLLFVFDILLYNFYIEREAGLIKPEGIGLLPSTTLTFITNTTKELAKADLVKLKNSDSHVLGLIYKMNTGDLLRFCKARAKNFSMQIKTISVIFNGSTTEVVTLVPKKTSIVQPAVAFDWYLDFMIAGAKFSKFPQEYIDYLKSIPTCPDPYLIRSHTFSDMLHYPKFSKKIFTPTISLIKKLLNGGKFKIVSPDNGYDRRPIEIVKAKKGFAFSTNVQIKKGIQNHKELEVGNTEIVFEKGTTKWYTNGRHFFATNIQYDQNYLQKIIEGTISEISTISQKDMESCFLRTLIPIPNKIDISRDFQNFQFLIGGQPTGELMKLNIQSNEIHFYSLKLENQNYIVVDFFEKMSVKQSNETLHAVLLVFALLKGQFLSGEAYTLAFADKEMEKPVGILYQEMNDPILDLPGVFTTNPYTGIDTRNLQRDIKGNFLRGDIDRISTDMDYFPLDVYSKLSELILTNEKVLRSLILLVNNQNSTLEIKVPVQYVALEAITGTFVEGGNKELKPIQNEKLAQELLDDLKNAYHVFISRNNLSDEDIEKTIPILKKIETLNNPPNADKLSKSFDLLNYSLNSEEKKIVKLRNKFLHGSTVNFENEDSGFKELFYISLRLHFLLAVLLLKKAGFKGKIINHVKLWEHITEAYFSEEPLVKI